MNTDEAVALGAVYQGAGHTKLFRVKKFIVKEGVVYPIQVRGGEGKWGGGLVGVVRSITLEPITWCL